MSTPIAPVAVLEVERVIEEAQRAARVAEVQRGSLVKGACSTLLTVDLLIGNVPAPIWK